MDSVNTVAKVKSGDGREHRGQGRCVAFSAIALRVRHTPVVGDIPFRKDGPCEVEAQLHEPLGEPLRNTASALK